jgi:hypothetical protein
MTITLHAKEMWEQLMLLRDLTEKSGALHEAQVLQLKLWPLTVFDTYANGSEFQFSWEKHEIDFYLTTSSKHKPPKDMDSRLKILDTEVKNLLGDSYLVRVRVRGKVIFRGIRKKAWTPPKSP